MSEWTKLVSATFKKNRKTNKNYKFKDALMDAKKVYKTTTGTVNSMGPGLALTAARGMSKALKTRKGRKGRKSRRHRGGEGVMDSIKSLAKVGGKKQQKKSKKQQDVMGGQQQQQDDKQQDDNPAIGGQQQQEEEE